MLLRELGVPFELRLVDRKQGAQHSAEYLRLNPQGLIPVLVDGELVLTETAATRCIWWTGIPSWAGTACGNGGVTGCSTIMVRGCWASATLRSICSY